MKWCLALWVTPVGLFHPVQGNSPFPICLTLEHPQKPPFFGPRVSRSLDQTKKVIVYFNSYKNIESQHVIWSKKCLGSTPEEDLCAFRTME